MPFLFSYVCDLLQRLEDNRLARSGLRSNATVIREWFRGHQGLLSRDDHNSAVLLSALLPEKRADRVYFIREKKLQIIIGRALGLGRSRIAELGRWSNPEARADLADCVESILKQTPNPISPTHRPVTVEEIDGLLHSIAAACRFSSPAVRSSASENRPADQELSIGELYQRSSARDAKWLTRLILKNYEPVFLDLRAVCASYHPLLPAILKVQDDLAVAGRILDTLRRDRTVTGSSELAEYMKPTLGVKIGRQTWLKGRSIKHCLSMVEGRISCEEKMDGEYCQIHIDLSKGHDCIQIFSKSGKDSTKDRMALHDAIRKSLRLGQPSCPLKTGCILEGELVVYSDKHTKILDFHKIRKHVSRSGSFLGTDKDSQPHPWEHLMIVYYDLLMVDNESLLAVKHSERFQRLKSLITLVPGRSSLVKREIIDCGRRSTASDLRRAFAKCITAHGEGLVLKADDPYFDFGTLRRPYSACAIKFKKGYIGHFGDIGDFAVVGARFDATKARTYNMPRLKWTHFYVGCLENKDEVQRFGKQPQFVVTNVVELNTTQLEAFIYSVNPESVRPEDNTAISLRIEPGVDGGKRPSVIFPTPPVFDLRCFSFDKEGNTGFWSPRFASVSKIHCDRTYHDAISFAELQEMAAKEREAPPPDDSQELLGWIAALERSEPKTTVDATSQSTVCTTIGMTPSPQSLRSGDRRISVIPTSPTKKKPDSTTQIQAAPVGGQLTPPTSSDAQMPESATSGGIGKQDGAVLNRKRPLESSTQNGIPERNKIRRCASDRVVSAVHSPANNGGISSKTQREPLVDSRMDLSRRHTEAGLSVPRLSSSVSMHQPNSPDNQAGDAQRSTRASISFHEGPSQSLAAPSPADHADSGSGRVQVTGSQPSKTTAAKCRFLPDSCQLRTYSILLAPCIADFPWVADDLLSCHGVTEFLRDPKEWLSNQSATTTQLPTSTNASSGSTRHRKKMVLVDTRRKEAAVAFLQSIEAAQLKRANGEREYVPIYDWRALEAVREEEQKYSRNKWKPGSRLDLNGPGSVWRRFWVGLA
ncbi:hypothetical protein C8A00DRAFT_40028 [Chaetomidium leptoderma]|uniref:ATP-dependent DNA ligase family profile domain-containing protein n=1 Tax=Chaetomidium leptoderma TaxID=669021 RepID=A0AAN6VUP9_9PEZI|nr:hypothetical protein C8A00DRAFT_40028 [Chaetomidium leptoderma]